MENEPGPGQEALPVGSDAIYAATHLATMRCTFQQRFFDKNGRCGRSSQTLPQSYKNISRIRQTRSEKERQNKLIAQQASDRRQEHIISYVIFFEYLEYLRNLFSRKSRPLESMQCTRSFATLLEYKISRESMRTTSAANLSWDSQRID